MHNLILAGWSSLDKAAQRVHIITFTTRSSHTLVPSQRKFGYAVQRNVTSPVLTVLSPGQNDPVNWLLTCGQCMT
jgi:hypothetical protein